MKTGSNALQRAQFEDYLDVAREHPFDALITISNEVPRRQALIPGWSKTFDDNQHPFWYPGRSASPGDT